MSNTSTKATASVFQCEYGMLEKVYLKHDADQHCYMITQILFVAEGYAKYHLARGTTEFWAYEAELTRDRNIQVQES